MRRPPAALLPILAVVLAVAGVAAMLARGEPAPDRRPAGRPGDPFAWSPGRDASLAARAARGTSHGLYALSPGGAEASAARTARWRPLVDAAARAAGVRADTLEGLVFLESAGRSDAVTPAGLDGAVGLTQIVAQTGQDLLGMHIVLAASRRIARRLEQAVRRGDRRRIAALTRERARVDQRFDPRASLRATARYLTQARARFGRQDLAFVSYHMGQGNLEGVLRTYAADAVDPLRDVVRDHGLSYARVYFDSTPARHAAAWTRLAGLGDDSADYLWKVLAGREIMRLWRTDRAELRRRARLQTAAGSAEQLLHPPATTDGFPDAVAVQDGLRDGELQALPPAAGLRPAGRVALRPAALAMAQAMGTRVRALAPGTTLTVSAGVRGPAGDEDASSAALHPSGWAFDVARRYASPHQAEAFQFVLDRLSVLGAIAWQREGRTLHVVAASAP